RLAIVGKRDVAGFAAFGTVVQPVGAKPHAGLPFADGAILLAGTILFALVALGAEHLLTIGCHRASEKDFT
ncbi:MAG: hypothetical protein WB607_14700, partial [Candidatus Acidiferrum sp.]